jgi:hypothetical protein
MKIVEVKQNTADWYRARLGIPTASAFKRIVKANGRPSTQRSDYMYRLIWERIYQRVINEDVSKNFWVARGKQLEAEAAQYYQEITKENIEEVGLLLSDDGTYGCSPDRVLWDNDEVAHCVEIKVPTPWKHIKYSCMGPGDDYKQQMQGQMLITGCGMVRFFSYNPGMPCAIYNVMRDDDYIEQLKFSLDEFVEDMQFMEKDARALGMYEWDPEDGARILGNEENDYEEA